MPKKLPTLAGRFDTAVTATDHAREVATLQAEIAKLRQAQSPELEEQMAVLRAQLKAQSGEHDISVSLIDPNPSQPRQTIPQSSIRTLARSLGKDGQITPVILIPIGDRYLLWDGQRRWESAKYLAWETIRAVLSPMPEDLHRQSLLTFVHHEDLNPLDKAEAIVKEVAASSELDREAIPGLLSTVLRRLERQDQIHRLQGLIDTDLAEQKKVISQLDLHPNEEHVLLSLLELALNPPSVRSNLMPMLSLPLDLKSAIRERGLKGAHALALASLSKKNLKVPERQARKERLDATEIVLEDDLTVSKTRELVRKIKAKFVEDVPGDPKAIKTVSRHLQKLTTQKLESADRKDLETLHVILKKRLTEVEALLQT